MGSSQTSIKPGVASHNAGFTFVEVLIVVAITAALLGATGGLTRTYQTEQALQTAASVYAQNLHRAQLLSQNGTGDSPWGVSIATSSIVLFKGATYATRASGFDEQYSFGVALTVSGLQEVDFSKFTGTAATAGTTTITAAGAPGVKTIVVNTRGRAAY